MSPARHSPTPFKFLPPALALLILLEGCAINPATGGANLVLMTQSREQEIGTEEHDKVVASQSFFDDEELLAYVREVGNRVAAVSHRSDLEYHFNVIDSPDINAFALPGGYVYVNRGLLTFLNSEADLAAVLAHEVGHITARHAVQQHARNALARTASTVGGVVAGIATGSGYVGSQISQVTSIWAQAGLSGFGREHELEADRLGAEYLVRAGYDPMAMINVITVLKNQEDFNRRVSGAGGGYHGVFATHPRNDKRLQEIIASVGDLEEVNASRNDNAVFRDNLDGLILGENSSSSSADSRNRYYQTSLGYTVVFPDEWAISETLTTVTAAAPGAGSLRIEARRRQENIDPRVFIRDKMGIANLQKSEPLSQYRLVGHTGVVTSAETGRQSRVAAIYFGPRVYTFRGEIQDETAGVDDALLASIRTFRAIQRGELGSGDLKLKYVQADENFDFAVAAASSRIPNHPEETLRLLNGYYPRGNPEAGEWIKLVE